MPQSEGSLTHEATAVGEAMEQFRSEIDAMNDRDVVVARVDVAAAALTAIGSMPQIEAQRAAIVSIFGASGGETLDRLVPVARALMDAHAKFFTVVNEDLEPMAQQLVDVRTRLFIAASALIQRKVVHKKTLDSAIGGQSYQARITDTMGLVAWFKEQAPAIAGHTKVDDSELERAYALAQEFADAWAQRERTRAGTSKPARDRARAFTLFFRTYERIRQMLTYLRWHEGDLEQIAPSLFTRGPRKHDDDVTPDGDVGTPANNNPVPPGLPGGNPFITNT